MWGLWEFSSGPRCMQTVLSLAVANPSLCPADVVQAMLEHKAQAHVSAPNAENKVGVVSLWLQRTAEHVARRLP